MKKKNVTQYLDISTTARKRERKKERKACV